MTTALPRRSWPLRVSSRSVWTRTSCGNLSASTSCALKQAAKLAGRQAATHPSSQRDAQLRASHTKSLLGPAVSSAMRRNQNAIAVPKQAVNVRATSTCRRHATARRLRLPTFEIQPFWSCPRDPPRLPSPETPQEVCLPSPWKIAPFTISSRTRSQDGLSSSTRIFGARRSCS